MRYGFAMLVLAFGLAVLSTAPARADCVGECVMPCFGGGDSEADRSACLSREQVCQTQCYARQKRPSVVYGALAYGARSTAWGYAYDKDNANEAKATALNECKKNGNDCQIVKSYSNSCAAVAAVEVLGKYSVGQGKTERDAESSALLACTRAHGAGCEIEVQSCSFP